MTARYVDPTNGTDSGGGAIGAPWKTLTYAVNNATSGDTIEVVGSGTPEANWTINSTNVNGKTLSIYSTAGQKFTYTMSNTTRGILQTGSGWAGTTSITVSDLIFTCSTTVSNGILETIGTGAGTYSMTFSNVDFVSPSNNARPWYDNHSVTTLNFSYSFTSCLFSAASSAGSICDLQKPFDTISFVSCTFICGANGINAGQSSGAGGNGMNKITIDSCTFTATALTGSNACFYYNETNTNRLKNFICKNSIFNTNHHALKLQGAIKNIYVVGNTVTGSSQNILLLVGSDSNTGGANIDYAYVAGNNLTFTGTVSHAHFIGRYIQRGEYCYNTANGGDYGMVVKGNSKIFAHHNIAYNVKNGCIYLRGSADSIVTDNSFYRIGAGGHGSENFGIMVDSINDSGVYTDPARNTFKRNLIYIADGAPTSTVYGIWENDTSHPFITSFADHVFDFNTLRLPTNMNWAKFNGGTVYSTVALARTAWASYATVNYLNEANDQAADPMFSSPTNLTLLRSSPGLGTASTLYNNQGGNGYRLPRANRGVYIRSGR